MVTDGRWRRQHILAVCLSRLVLLCVGVNTAGSWCVWSVSVVATGCLELTAELLDVHKASAQLYCSVAAGQLPVHSHVFIQMFSFSTRSTRLIIYPPAQKKQKTLEILWFLPRKLLLNWTPCEAQRGLKPVSFCERWVLQLSEKQSLPHFRLQTEMSQQVCKRLVLKKDWHIWSLWRFSFFIRRWKIKTEKQKITEWILILHLDFRGKFGEAAFYLASSFGSLLVSECISFFFFIFKAPHGFLSPFWLFWP